MELHLDQIDCRRGDRMVFRGLSLTAQAGEAVIVRGPNGVGKSSLLRVLAGLVPLAAGDARLGEVSLAGDRAAFQEQVAYAGHLDAVKPALSVEQNLALWASVFGTGPDRVMPALAFFGLDRIATRPAAQCSAGQKRRLGLARLMVMERPLWLLDEPTVSLDTEATAGVADLVARHCAGGGLALIATHIDLGLPEARVFEMPAAMTETATHEESAFLAGEWT